MSIPPDCLVEGRCYLGKGNAPWVRRVVQILPDGRVRYEQRRFERPWKKGTQFKDVFASMVQRESPL